MTNAELRQAIKDQQEWIQHLERHTSGGQACIDATTRPYKENLAALMAEEVRRATN